MTTDDDSIGTSVDLEEVDRKLLAKQDQLEEPEPEPGLGEQFEAGGNGQEESETPIADEEVRQYQDQEQEQDGKKEAETDTHQQQQEEEGVSIIEEITEDILSRYRFLTIEESREILVYDKGVYAKGGEVQIEKTAESLYGYDLANRHLAEIKGHIMRMTYHKREELDADVNIINLKNGLYNIETGAFKEHTPDYLSITQKPIEYNLAAKPKLFGRYLRQVLYPTEIRTVIEVMAYTLYKDNPYEIMVKLFGYGANGKSVFTGLLTALHGAHNTSNVPLTSMLKNRFALSDLENKYINIDNELSSATIHDATILKKLTGRQPVRIERKNQRAYDTTLYAKLIFSANKIPETQDESDAFFRREMIISFPNRFEDGKGADPNLLRKMTTEEELSGIFNILAASLRRVLARGIFLGEKTIEERRLRHQLAVDPLNYFLTDAIAEDSVESDKVTKDELYEAYKRFCNMNRLAVESKISFGRIIKGKRVQEYRGSNFDGFPWFIIDRSFVGGSSGSLVITRPVSIISSNGTKPNDAKQYMFLGIYAAEATSKYHITDSGIVWYGNLIKDIILNGVRKAS